MTFKTLRDKFGNTATIEKVNIFLFEGSTIREGGFRLTLTADYENDFIYFMSVYLTEQDVMKKLSTISCGTFE